MAVKLSPEWRVKIYPHSAIPNRKYDAFVIADRMADLLTGAPSTGAGILMRGGNAGAFGTTWHDWQRLGHDLTVSNVGFARFLPSGQVSFDGGGGEHTGAGFFVLPTYQPLSAVGPDLGVLGATSPGRPQRWIVTAGTWHSVNSTVNSGRLGVLNMGNPEELHTARSAEQWPQGKGIRFDVTAWGGAGNVLAEHIIQVGPELRIALRQAHAPSLERLQPASSSTPEKWMVWAAHQDHVFRTDGKMCTTGIYILGGRLIWEYEGSAKWLLEQATDGTSANAKPNPGVKFQDMSKFFGGAEINLRTYNMRSKTEVSAREHGAEGEPATAIITRRVPRPANSEQLGATMKAVAIGHMPPGTAMEVTTSHNSGYTEYTATLTTTDDTLHTPLLTQVLMVYEPVWTNGSGAGVDVSAAVTRASLSLAAPPVQAGAEGSLELDLKLLERISGALAVTQDYAPVTIETRWCMNDGTKTDFKPLFFGYLFGTQGENSEYNQASLTFTLRDTICRLRSPAGLVDGTVYPLDFAYWKQLRSYEATSQADAEGFFGVVRGPGGRILNARPLTMQQKSFYAWQCVQEILRQFLGDSEANKLAHYPADAEFPYFSPDYVASSWLGVSKFYGQALTAGSLEAQTRFKLPAPFGEDALSWLNKFAADTFSLFFYGFTDRDEDGYPTSDTGYPVPVFGSRMEIFRSMARIFTVSGTDAEQLLVGSSSFETKPEGDYNRVVVWSNSRLKGNYPQVPAFIQGEARLEPDNPRSEENTWRRTLKLENNLPRTSATAAVTAAIALAEIGTDSMLFPRLTLPLGDGRLYPGDVIVAANSGDLGMDGLRFGTTTIEHEYTLNGNEGRRWTTTAGMYRLSQRESNALP